MTRPDRQPTFERPGGIPLLMGLFAVAMLTGYPSVGLGLDPDRRISQYLAESWTDKRGLPQNNVESIAQTGDGYLWFALEKSLVRFDGVSLRVFDSRTHPEMKNVVIKNMISDGEDGLWLGAQAGLFHFDGTDIDVPSPLKSLRDSWIRSLADDGGGGIWIGTRLNGIYHFADGELTHYSTGEGLPDNNINKIAVDTTGRLWFIAGSTNVGFVDRGRVSLFRNFSFNISTIFADRHGDVWLGTSDRGAMRICDGAIQTFGTAEGLPQNSVVTFGQDSDDNIWISTLNGGLARVNGETVTGETDFLRLGAPVQFFFEDSERNLWCAVFTSGVHRLRDGNVTVYSEEHGLVGRNVSVLYERSAGGLWIGTAGGRLNYLVDGEIKSLTFPGQLPERAFIYSMLETGDGDLWLGLYGVGLGLVRGGELTLFGSEDTPSFHAVFALYEDRSGLLWIGTWDGLFTYDGESFRRYGPDDGVEDRIFRGITQDRNGDIWVVASETGVYKMNGDKFINFNTEDGLSGSNMQSITETSDGAIWATTYGFGINRIKDGEIRSITEDEGLTSNITYDVLEDGEGNLWVTTHSGVNVLDAEQLEQFLGGKRAHLTPRYVGLDDGMLTADMSGGTQYNALKTGDGHLFFSTANGLVEVVPGEARRPAFSPPVHIETVFADGVPLRSSAPGDFDVPAGTESVEIQYTAPSFTLPHRVRFEYRTEGFDSDWVNAGTRRSAFYTNIPPGQYAFSVRTGGTEIYGNARVATVRLRFLPFFYQTAWFRILLAAAVVALILLVYRLRVRAIRDKDRRLIQQDKMVSLGVVSSGIAHEINNPNNYILLNAKLVDRMWHDLQPILKEHLEERGDFCVGGLYYSESAEEIGELVRGILDGSSRIKRIVETLKHFAGNAPETIDQAVNINEVVKVATTIVRGTINKATGAFDLRLADDIPTVRGNAQQLEQVVINLVTNACDALTSTEQAIRVRTGHSPKRDMVEVTVEDEGRGISRRELSHILDPFFTTKRDRGGTGLGLTVSYNIVRKHDGELVFDSSVEDGTTVVMRIAKWTAK